MFHNGLDVLTQREIDKVVRDTLREAGLVEPPVRIQDLLDHLRLYRDFYNLHELPMVMVVSTPYWMDTPDDQQNPLRHFVRSAQCKGEFSSSDPERILLEIDRNIWERTGGPVGDFGLCLQNDNRTPHEFRAESFFNRHYVLTMIVHQQKLDGRRIVLP